MTRNERPVPSVEGDTSARPADVAPLLSEVDEAAKLLHAPGADDLARAQQRLRGVEASLSGLAARIGLSSATAPSLLALRDELSAHLLASTMLGPLDLHDQATTVLRRAVVAVRAGLDALLVGGGAVVSVG